MPADCGRPLPDRRKTLDLRADGRTSGLTVIGFDHGYVRVLGEGKETTVYIVNIDSGWDEQYAPASGGSGREIDGVREVVRS